MTTFLPGVHDDLSPSPQKTGPKQLDAYKTFARVIEA
jgi:hypothetical protein